MTPQGFAIDWHFSTIRILNAQIALLIQEYNSSLCLSILYLWSSNYKFHQATTTL